MATTIARKIIKYPMLLITAVVSILYIAASLSPNFSYHQYSYFGFIALAFPYLFTSLFFLCLFWLFAKPYIAFIPLIIMAVGYNQLQVTVGINTNTTFNKQKKENDIRVVSWNIQGFNGLSNKKNTLPLVRKELAESIFKLNADIVCLQEFNHSFLKSSNANNIELFTSNFPYYYFSTTIKKSNGYASGCIIFSRYPIIHSDTVKYINGQSLAYIDFVYKKDTCRVYTTHLQSFKFKATDYNNIDKVSDVNNSSLDAGKNIIQKMRPAFKSRALQANTVKAALQQCTYPLIITGDFNDVPTSYTYHTIRGNKQDAFLSKDFGIGKTFIALAPTLRIDYILPDTNFYIRQFDLIDEGLSDHSMLVTDVQLKQRQ